MYKFHNNKLPLSFSKCFVRVTEIILTVNTVNTRSSASGLKYYIPQYKTNKLQRSIKYVGVKIWNKIPGSIKLNTYSQFIKQLKLDLLNN